MEQAIMATGVVLVGIQALHLIIHTIHFIQIHRKLDKIMKMIPQPLTYEDMNEIEAPLILEENWRTDQ